jgi:hemoglobin
MSTENERSLFERAGGEPAVARLVDRFYDEMEHNAEAAQLRALHSADLTGIRQVLKLYLSEWLGGPRAYSAVRGHPRLRARHLPFAIGIAERDAWLACMRTALAEAIPDQEARLAIYAAMERLADFMRNQPHETTPGEP